MSAKLEKQIKDQAKRILDLERTKKEQDQKIIKMQGDNEKMFKALQAWEEPLKRQMKITHSMAVFTNIAMSKLGITQEELSAESQNLINKREKLKNGNSDTDTTNS